MHIESTFKFHPVGFGLFTSGKIGNFRFVYDCGSTITRVAEDCVNREFKEHDHLNLLAISHFHKDHISGLNQLLTLVDKVDTIVLPYLTPKERLIYLLFYYKYQAQIEEESWIVRFLQDPVGFLDSSFKHKIGKIILIKGNSDVSSESDDNNSDNIKESDYIIDFSKLESIQDEDAIKDIEGISDEKVSIRKSGKVYLYDKTKIWQFIFYYPNPSPIAVKYFTEILKKARIGTIQTKEDLIKIISTKKFTGIAKVSKISNKEINNTSLLLYHSPFSNFLPDSISWVECLTQTESLRVSVDCCVGKDTHCGFFYTGDIDLKSRYNEISTYYKELLDQISVFQIPHHGSIENWTPSISYRNQGALHVVSSKLSNNKLLHPNPKVLHSIVANNGLILWCNEENTIWLNVHLWV